MKAFQKFIQLSLILVITLTTMGFRVNTEECRGHATKTITFFGEPGCCCENESKTAQPKENTCNELTCVVQASLQSQLNLNSATQSAAKALKAVPVYPTFTQVIRPVLQEKTPYFTLPPPRSGKTIGILYQTFLI
ncbi:hypothetical protein [Adhaeribacter rhizoryzae]|uniref:Uncharacterized protein n=1 Tax=Adhaeribacter rhizoryzae TaxID=2607907 RepID=A0A5M6DBC0_9BACT|nr:hypothetical protein [Adhaeribacter rhizoryzae]KAA5544858.1 hypothetical protein F0145_14345 [Adhaeribacter rhizoryzae]